MKWAAKSSLADLDYQIKGQGSLDASLEVNCYALELFFFFLSLSL